MGSSTYQFENDFSKGRADKWCVINAPYKICDRTNATCEIGNRTEVERLSSEGDRFLEWLEYS